MSLVLEQQGGANPVPQNWTQAQFCVLRGRNCFHQGEVINFSFMSLKHLSKIRFVTIYRMQCT